MKNNIMETETLTLEERVEKFNEGLTELQNTYGLRPFAVIQLGDLPKVSGTNTEVEVNEDGTIVEPEPVVEDEPVVEEPQEESTEE